MTDWLPLRQLTRRTHHRAVRELLRRVENGEWEGRLTAGGHIQLRHKRSGGVVTLSSTPSKYSAIRNAEAAIRRLLREGKG